jgi:DNA-binding MarR family transcriptional regulator
MCKKNKVSNLKDHLGFWIRMVSNNVSHNFSLKLEKVGVTVAEWVLLRELYEYNETIQPSKVAEITGLTRGTVSKLIDRLLKKDLVTREESLNDRRFQNIKLTEKAIKLVPELTKIADENDNLFFSVITLEEKKELKKILIKLANLNNIKGFPID